MLIAFFALGVILAIIGISSDGTGEDCSILAFIILGILAATTAFGC